MHFLSYFLIPQLVSAAALGQRATQKRALYFLNAAAEGSEVMAMDINDNGTLSGFYANPTGQLGLLGVNLPIAPSTTPEPGPFDPLFSQGAIRVFGNYLFTVNTGSNTMSMFIIDPANPTAPKLVNSAPTLGNFPMSVAYSAQLKTACTINGGSVPGVACFSVDHAKGLTPITGLLPVGSLGETDTIGQSYPPLAPFNTTSDIQFSPCSKYLMMTLKGGSLTSPGKVYIWPVVNGQVQTTPVVTVIDTLILPFGFNFLSNNKIVVTDAASGYSIVNVNPTTFEVSLIQQVKIPSSKLICWTAYAPRFNTLFMTDGGVGFTNITLVDSVSGQVKGEMVQPASQVVGLDITVDRTFVYNLKGDNTISVADISGLNNKSYDLAQPEFQAYTLPGDRRGYTGMTVYPSGGAA